MLRDAAYDAFVAGNHQQAIAEAFRVVEVRVRAASRIQKDGVPLMRDAFNEENGPLRSHAADRAERPGLMELFTGAFLWVRNAMAHREVPGDNVTAAAELLMLASLLLRVVDHTLQRETVVRAAFGCCRSDSGECG